MNIYIRVGGLSGDINCNSCVLEALIFPNGPAVPNIDAFDPGKEDWHWRWEEVELKGTSLTSETKSIYAVDESAFDWPTFKCAFLTRTEAEDYAHEGLVTGKFLRWNGFKSAPHQDTSCEAAKRLISEIELADLDIFLAKQEELKSTASNDGDLPLIDEVDLI